MTQRRNSITGMEYCWYWLYNGCLAPVCYGLFLLGGLVHPKLRRVREVRRGWQRRLRQSVETLDASAPRVLLHVASVGEWEQTRPVVVAIRAQSPDVQICVSIMSPTAWDHCRMSGEVQLLTWLPLDTRRSARIFFEILQPSVWILVRNEIWPNHIWECRRRGIPLVWIDANLPASSRRFWWPVRSLFKHLCRNFDAILPVSQACLEQFADLIQAPVTMIPAGDTRYDQVYSRCRQPDVALLTAIRNKVAGRIVIAGSTWPSDEVHVIPMLGRWLQEHTDFSAIIVPHEPHEAGLRTLERQWAQYAVPATRLSQLETAQAPRVVLVDRVGLLASLYHLAEVAYVGGSFGPGVHNVMEPAILGVPVLFGPRHTNSYEAIELLQQQGAFCMQTAQMGFEFLHTLCTDAAFHAAASRQAQTVMMARLGATQTVMSYITKYLPHDTIPEDHTV